MCHVQDSTPLEECDFQVAVSPSPGRRCESPVSFLVMVVDVHGTPTGPVVGVRPPRLVGHLTTWLVATSWWVGRQPGPFTRL